MRRSLEGIQHWVKDIKYRGLPDELNEFHYYLKPECHCIMAIPEALLSEAEADGDLDIFEHFIPVKYILTHGYRIYKDHVVANVEYNSKYRLLVVPHEYLEYEYSKI